MIWKSGRRGPDRGAATSNIPDDVNKIRAETGAEVLRKVQRSRGVLAHAQPPVDTDRRASLEACSELWTACGEGFCSDDPESFGAAGEAPGPES
jgi:hypothetical protein